MIGSPDLLAFAGGFEEEGEEQESRTLPEEYLVPLSPPGQPWSSAAQFHRDFILVAEFSEQVGPKPVLTIPEEQKVIGTFDLNHFSVRIMSVDYQASGPGPSGPASPGPRLNFSEDSKVILGDSGQDAFAYVHHLTLYDLEARGMVRPFCMAYVCSDQAKLMENFVELSECFSGASDSLKTGNRQAFSTELQRKLQDLEYRRWSLLEEMNASVEGPNGSDDLEAVEQSILNHRELLRQVTSYPNRKLKQPDFLPYDPADSLTDMTPVQPPERSSSSLPTSTSCGSEQHLKSLEELCNDYFLSLMKEQLVETELRLRGDRSVLRTTRVTKSLSRRLKLTNFLFELHSDGVEDAEEEEEAACTGMETQDISASKKGDVECQTEPQAEESDCSCVKEIPITLEAREAARATLEEPDASAEMTESLSSSDSIEVLGTEKSYRAQQGAVGLDSKDTPMGLADVFVRHAPVDAGVKRVRVSAKRANSEDSIEVLSTTESIFPDDLAAITEEEAEQYRLTNGLQHEGSLNGRRSDELREKTANAATLEQDKCGETLEPLKNPALSISMPFQEISINEGEKDAQENGTRKEAYKIKKADRAVNLAPLKLRPVPDLHVEFAPPLSLGEASRRGPPHAPLRMLSISEVSDCTSFTSCSEPPSPTHNIDSGARVERRRGRRRAALRALRFIKQLSFSQHAIFCLLSGRPLVVVGGDERSVRKLVDGLSLFLPAPGPDGSAVMPCLTTPLQLTDLLTWRLIGMHRTSSGTSSPLVKSLTQLTRYLAVLDLDQRTLRCPSYSGSLVSVLANPHTGISRGLTYLLHLESCLAGLANKVLLHTFAPAAQKPDAAVEDEDTREDSLSNRQSCSTESDFKVIHFLSDLIKQRYTGWGPPVLRFSYSSTHLHKNVNTT